MALSTIEVEYMAAVEASKEVLWLTGLVGTFGIIQDPVQVFCGSQSVIHLGKDHMYYKQTKHINLRYHMIHYWAIVKKGY